MVEGRTTRVEYIGSARPGVVIRQGNGGDTVVIANFGEPVDVPADIAKGLLDQPDNWRTPKPGPKPGPDADKE